MIERNTDEVHGPDLAIIVPRDRRRRRMAGDCSKPPHSTLLRKSPEVG